MKETSKSGFNKKYFLEDKEPIKAAIIYLVRSKPKDIADLKRRLSLLDANFNDQFNYPVIIFRHLSLKDYDWYWWLDTDSFLLDKIDYDVFYFMQKK